MSKCVSKKNGFTLVELMITVAIIGLLAAFAIPNYVRSRAAAQVNNCINNLRQIDNAIQQFASESHKAAHSRVSETDVTPFLKNVLACPAGGHSFSDSYTVTHCDAPPICKSPGGGAANGHVLAQ
jgi:prepilin-type N-terminal cleavage/methylation domain-containing protein